MSEKIKIVIVDSGVKLSHNIFKNANITSLEYRNGMLETIYNDNDTHGHGTAIAGIISHNTINADIIIIKAPDIENGLDEDTLIDILELIYYIDDVSLINLSLGLNICDKSRSLETICNKLNEKGICIVSAFDNSGSISYPAAFDSVIGVVGERNCTKTNDFLFFEDSMVNIAARSSVQRVPWIFPNYLLIGGTSFACAHVTVQAAKFIQSGIIGTDKILSAFSNIAKQHFHFIDNEDQKYSNIEISKIPFNIKHAALFPFNKEMHSILRYEHMLPFSISNIYDTRFSVTVGATAAHLMKDPHIAHHTIKNIEDIEWSEFDTLILGHTNELSALINKDDLVSNLINLALKKEKQIFSFDDIYRDGYKSYQNIYCPITNKHNLPPDRFGMLYRISKPVVGIFGTSSRQGKFTLQLKLREILLKQGYNVGQIGTEPSAQLFGIDYCYPMGYNSSVYITGYDTIRYLNYIENDLCKQCKDIIIVGSQSGTVPYDFGNISQYTIPQYELLMGANPDCVILCINPFDEIDYIKRTVNYIESIIDCKVIALVVFL